MLISSSSEEPAALAGAADTRSVVDDKVRSVPGGADTALAPLEPVAGGADAGSGSSEPLPAGAGSDSAGSDAIPAFAGGAGRGRVSVVLSVSSALGDEVFRASVAAVSDRSALVDFLCCPLRNRRHVSELCSASAALFVIPGFVAQRLLS